MTSDDCLFCRVVRGDLPTTKRYEDGDILAFDDIHPQAPVHLLVIPKRHIASLAEATDDDARLLGQLLLTVKRLAREYGLPGFKTQIHTGREGGQVIDHLHVHLLGGRGGVTASPDTRAA